MADRIAIVGLWHETNSYASTPLTLAGFEQLELLAGEAIRTANAGVATVIGGFLSGGAAHGLDLVPVLSAAAWPCGPCSAETLADLLGRIETGLREQGPFAGVLLNLHGAMAVPGVAEVEGSVVERVRAVVGPVPIAAVLDLHANVSTSLAAGVDALISYDTYPHVDMAERGAEAAGLMRRMIDGEQMVTTLGRLPLLTVPMGQATDAEPMRGLIVRARARAADAGLVRICLTPGFPYADVASAGFAVFAISGPDRTGVAAEVVAATLADVDAHADDFRVVVSTPEQAVADVLADPVPGTTVLVDVADNIGGGTAGDSVAILAELIRQGATGAAVTVADAEVARRCHELGVGATLCTALGGKTDQWHGPPVEMCDAVVLALSDGEYVATNSYMSGRTFHLGRSALLRIEGVSVLVTELPVPPFHADQLRTVGVEPEQATYLTAKGAIAWRAAFPFAAREVLVEGPGACPVSLERLPRAHEPVGVVPAG